MADYNSSYTGQQIDNAVAAGLAARNSNGILKGDGAGNVSAAAAGTDYATPTVVVTVTSSTPTITAEANHRYICGEVVTLDLTPPASGICDVVFTSGSTATVLTVPSTVKWANGFDPSSLEANTTYEINVMDSLGVAAKWI